MMRRGMVRFGLLGLGCGIALCVLEVVIRLTGLAPSHGVGSVTVADFERVPGLLTPGQDLIDREKPALPYHVRINAHGYRGADLPDSAQTGELRILAIGDSFTYGDFVNDEETLPAQLAAALADRCPSVGVINAGIGGTTLVTHEQMLRRALALEPDVVLLTFSENDIVDLAAPMWWSLAENRRAKSRFPLSVVYPLLRHTALWNFALQVRGASLARARPEDAQATEPSAEERAQQRERTAALRDQYADRLEQIRDLAAANGIVLVYALYPSHHSVLSVEREEQMDFVEGLGTNLGLVTVNLLGPLRESGEPIEHLYLLPEDGHPSPRGYEVAAKALAQRVDWSKWAPIACPSRGVSDEPLSSPEPTP